jgi:hypothetical protein
MPSESTITQYNRVIATLVKRGVKDFSDSKEVLALIQTTAKGEKASNNSIKNNLNAVMYHIGKASPAWEVYRKEMYAIGDTIKQVATYTATEKSVPWKVLSELYKKYDGQDRRILAVYSLAPPRRLHDYASMRVVARKPRTITSNILVINKSGMTFHFADYKTKAQYGVQSFKVPAMLRQELEDFAVAGRPLFALPSGLAFADTQFSTHIGNLTAPFGTRATPTSYRHSYITHFLATNPTTDQRKTIASMMGHSSAMQMEYDERAE